MATTSNTAKMENENMELENGKGYIRVKGNNLELGFNVRMDKNDKNPTFHEIIVDMSDTSREELYKLAACTIKIRYQQKLRDLDRAFVKELSKEVRKVKLSELTAGLEDNRPSAVNVAKAMFNTKEPSAEQIQTAISVLKSQNVDFKIA